MYTYFMTAIVSPPVLSVVEARSKLGQLIKQLADDSTTPIYIGSHRKPSAVLLPVGKAFDQSGIPRLASVKEKSKFLSLLMKQFNVRRIGVFGSVARGTDHSESDIDFALDSEAPVELATLVDIELLLEELFQNKVHVTQVREDSRFAKSISNDLVWLA